MHILSKAYAPRLRYDEINVVLACWFNAHYPTHHDSDGAKATYAKKRILELRGYTTWEALKDDLKIRSRTLPKTDLKMITLYLKEQLKAMGDKQ